MDAVETCFRERNVRLFLLIGGLPTVRAAAKAAGIHPQHATRLVRIWRRSGWITRNPTLHGQRYLYTDKGQCMKGIMGAIPFDEMLNGR